MTLLVPAALGFLALLPVILVLHMLRTRRPPVRIPSTLLWRQITRETTGKVSWRPPRWTPLLLLQLLLVALMALALAQPARLVVGQQRNVYILLDSSGSMQAMDVAPNRFARARAEAADLIGSLSEVDQVTVIRMGPRAEVVGTGEDRAVLQRRLDGLTVGGGKANAREALLLTRSLAEGKSFPSIHIFSDGGIDTADLPEMGIPVSQVLIGAGSQNQAISHLAVRPSFGATATYEAFARVANFADQPVEVPVRTLADGVVFDRRTVQLPARGQVEMVLRLPAGTRLVEVRADTRDDLPVDNLAQAVVPATEPLRVALVSEVPIFLEKVLKPMPGVEVQSLPPADYIPESGTQLTILDGYLPAEMPPGNLILLNPRASNALLSVEGEAVGPVITRWDQDNPLLESIDPAGLPVPTAPKIKAPAWATVAAEAGGYPIIFSGITDGRKIVVLAFDPYGADLPLRVAFPLLVHNAVAWLGSSGLPPTLDPGKVVSLQPPPDAQQASVRQPDGRVAAFTVATGKPIYFADTEQVGRYIVSYQSSSGEVGRQFFVVNAGSDAESDIRPRQVEVPRAQGSASGLPVTVQEPARVPIWPILTALAVGVLLVEWWGARRWA